MVRHESEDGFTLVELMVVVLIIGILISIGLPVFLAARERTENRAAQSDLRNAMTAGVTVYTDHQTYTGVTAATMHTVEPSLSFVVSGMASSSVNDYAVSFRVFNYGEINAARMSPTGECYYIRNIQAQGPAPTDIPGTYMGHYNGACTGNAIASFGTTPARFGGW